MAALKWILVVVFGLGGAGSLAMAFVSGGAPYVETARTAPPAALRDFPQMVASVGTVKAPDVAKTPEPLAEKPPEPVAEKPPEPVAAKTPEPVAAKPEPKPEPVAAKPPAPVVAKPEATPEPVAKAPPPVAKPPEPVAKAEPKPEPKPEPVAKPPEPKPEPVAAAPKAPPAEGVLNLRATDTADVYLDGKKLGGSPLIGIKARVGNHKVRFDCYDAAGNTVAGPAQTISVKADAEVEVEYPCPVE